MKNSRQNKSSVRSRKKSASSSAYNVKRGRFTPITILVVVGVLFAGLMVYKSNHNKADALSPDYICSAVWTSCINHNANPIRLNSSQAVRYSFSLRGTVNGAYTWPFNPGSGYNSHYDGKNVYILYQPDGTHCLGYDEGTSPTQLNTWANCNRDNKKLWWIPNGGWLVNVGRTNASGGSYPANAFHMVANCGSVNCKVLVSNGSGFATNLENWTY